MTTSMQPESKTLTVNGLALHYLEWGTPDAPPIVCVHGYTGSADAFNALARHLRDRFHILALDVRGHGESAWSPTGAYRYADQASDLAEFARQLGLDKFVLIGTSMGGIIAMAYAAEHAEQALGPGDQRHRTRCRGRHPAHHPDGRQPARRVRDPRRGDGLSPRDLADHRRAQRRGPARAGAGRAAPQRPDGLGMEDGSRPISGSGSSTARRRGLPYGRRCRPSLARPSWCGVRRATYFPKRRRSTWSTRCRAASWSAYLASDTRLPWWSRWFWRPSTVSSETWPRPADSTHTDPVRTEELTACSKRTIRI